MLSRAGVWFMRFLAHWPLPWLRALGALLGAVLWLVVVPRRHVASVNLRLCLPELSEAERRRLVRDHFRCFAQAWLDRSWLWHAPLDVVRQRLRLVGAVHELSDPQPCVVFAPHFVGMDAGWAALLLNSPRPWATIYTPQANAVLDAWVLRGRQRFTSVQVLRRENGVKPIVASLRDGGALYLLPDMNFGPKESIFVPFFGVQAATVPSLPRFARLGRARVVPVISRLVSGGYEVQVLPAWGNYPSEDVSADTGLMNRRLADWVRDMPSQYYWVHKRFKTRPPGEPSVY